MAFKDRDYELQVDQLACNVVRPEALVVFANNVDKIYEFWRMLHTMTNVPDNTQDTSAQIMKAFQFLDNTMANREYPHQLCRLSHIALTSTITRFKKIIGLNRRQGNIRSRSGYRDAAVVMDLYLDSQGIVSDKVQAKKLLNRRIQTSRRWTELASSYPLLLVTYSDAAESLVSVCPSLSLCHF